MDELELARKERDEAFSEFIKHSQCASKADLQARAARHAYTLASDEVRSLERDYLAYPITI